MRMSNKKNAIIRHDLNTTVSWFRDFLPQSLTEVRNCTVCECMRTSFRKFNSEDDMNKKTNDEPFMLGRNQQGTRTEC